MKTITTALLEAKSPLIITSHLGRSPKAVFALSSLASLLAIPVLNSCPSTVNLPFSHPSYTGITFLSPGSHWEGLKSADVILVIDSDLPWIVGNDKPQDSARVFIIDGADPLRVNIGTWHISAEMICRADAFTALAQLGDAVSISENENADLKVLVGERRKIVEATHAKLLDNIERAESAAPYPLSASDGETSPKYTFSVPTLIGVLKKSITAMTPSKGENVLYLNESISNYPAVWLGLRAEHPGSVVSSGGSSLGWGLGAAVGASLGCKAVGNLGAEHTKGRDLIVVIVGDGSFMFGVPSSAYWMARRYETVCTLMGFVAFGLTQCVTIAFFDHYIEQWRMEGKSLPCMRQTFPLKYLFLVSKTIDAWRASHGTRKCSLWGTPICRIRPRLP